METMTTGERITVEKLDCLPAHRSGTEKRWEEALSKLQRKVVVLDDDPTGIQTVHDVYVYTKWDRQTMKEAFEEDEKMFFILTNSRGLTEEESKKQHREIARNLAWSAKETGQDFILISRGDSTLRGHWPMETEILRETLEEETGKRFDGEIVYPFFPEGGRYTIDDIHYVKQDNLLIPVGETEFAKDKSFGFTASSLPDWIEEKTKGTYRAEDVICIGIKQLREGDTEDIAGAISHVQGFEKIIVNSADYNDVKEFVIAFCSAINDGKEYIFRSAAALPKVLGGVRDEPLLKREDLIDPGNTHGGMIIVGSHVKKTTRQLDKLKNSGLPVEFIEFNQHRVLEEQGLEKEAQRVLCIVEDAIQKGKTVAVYTRRERLDLDTENKDEQLQMSVRISNALTSVVGNLTKRPSFLIAKGGITSSDVGTKALKVHKAMVKGQIRPGIPVWQTGAESKFPDLPYIIFPGNVGTEDDLLELVSELNNKQ